MHNLRSFCGSGNQSLAIVDTAPTSELKKERLWQAQAEGTGYEIAERVDRLSYKVLHRHWQPVVKGIFDTRAGSGYDDEIIERYHFPNRYLPTAQRSVGDRIIYREPQRGGGRSGYVATALVVSIEPDPQRGDHSYAFVERFLPFDTVVPLRRGEVFFENHLNAVADRSRIGAALQGQYSAALRTRVPDKPPPPIYSISRGVGVHVFSAMPVIVDNHVAGVIYTSRTPSNIFEHLYQERGKFILAGLVVVLATIAIGLVFSRTITRPMRELIDRAARIGKRRPQRIPAAAALRHP